MAAVKKSYFLASAKKGLTVSYSGAEKENPQNPSDLKKGTGPTGWETCEKCPAF